jgi:hypothetical protein
MTYWHLIFITENIFLNITYVIPENKMKIESFIKSYMVTEIYITPIFRDWN